MLTVTARIGRRAQSPLQPIVLGLEGEDRLSAGFLWQLDLATGERPPAAAVLGQGALVAIQRESADRDRVDPARAISAVVTGWDDLGTVEVPGKGRLNAYRARLEPALARLDHDLADGVHRGRTAIQVATDLLAGRDHEGAAADPALAVPFYDGFLTAPRPVRQQVLRWRESTAATVRRLLEDEGVFTYHVHQADGGGDGLGGHTLVLSEINRNHGGSAAGEDEQAQARRRRAANPLASDVVGERGAAGATNRCLWRWQTCERDGAAGVAVADRDYRDWSANAAVGDQAGTSALDLAALGSPAVPAGLMRHEFPAGPSALKDGSAFAPGAPDTSLAEWLAERRAGEQLCRRRRLHGEGDHTHLQAGTVMAFAARPDETFLVVGARLSIRPLLTAAATGPASEALRPLHDALAALALSAAEVRWTRPAFDLLASPPQTPGATLSWQGLGLEARCSVEALPLAIPFVPERRQPPPALAGVHLATVVAEDGTAEAVNTLHTDALARVQVAFPWDRSHPTGWIRVVMPQAGKGGGSLILPRVGDEVAVAFAWGGADQPVVLGGLFNHANRPHNPMVDQPYRTVLRSRGVGAGGAIGGAGEGPAGGAAAPSTGNTISDNNDPLPIRTRIANVAPEGQPKCWALVDAGNQDTPPPALADRACNELAFDDGGGRCGATPRTDLFASNNLNLLAGQDGVLRVGGDLTIEAGNSLTIRVGNTMLRMEQGSLMLGVYSASDPDISSAISFTPLCLNASAPTVAITGLMTASLNSSGSSVVAETVNVTVSAVSAEINTNAIGGGLGFMVDGVGGASGGKVQGNKNKKKNKEGEGATDNTAFNAPGLISFDYEVSDHEEIWALVNDSVLAAFDLGCTVAYLIKAKGLWGSASMWCIGGTAEIYSTTHHGMEWCAGFSSALSTTGSLLANYPNNGCQYTSEALESCSIVFDIAESVGAFFNVYKASWELFGSGEIKETCLKKTEEFGEKNELGAYTTQQIMNLHMEYIRDYTSALESEIDRVKQKTTLAEHVLRIALKKEKAVEAELEHVKETITLIESETKSIDKKIDAAAFTAVALLTRME